MGRDKASLPFGPEQMLQRVVRLLSTALELQNLVVVAAPGQAVPTLPASIAIVRDAREYRGPLEGMATGFRTLGDRVEAAYVTGCDVPLLVPALVDHMFKSLADYDISVPVEGENYHPLAAVYRPGVLPKIEELLAADRLRPRFLFDEVRTREIDVNELRAVDPELATLKNLNSPDDYLSALASAGFGPPPDA